MGYTLVNEDKVWLERCKAQADFPEAKQKGISADRLWDELQAASDLLKPQWKYVMAKYGFTESAKYNSAPETLYGDTCSVLERLSKSFRLGIIANQSGGLSERLRNFGIDKYFSTVISSSDYGISKPDKRLFTVALEKSGCAAQSAVMVGDRLDNDILPANELGLVTVRVKQGFAKNQIPPSDSYKPTYEVNNLTGILDLPFAQNKR